MIRPVEGPTICHLWAVVIQHLAIVVSKRKILAQPAQLKTSSDNNKKNRCRILLGDKEKDNSHLSTNSIPRGESNGSYVFFNLSLTRTVLLSVISFNSFLHPSSTVHQHISRVFSEVLALFQSTLSTVEVE